MFSEFSLHERLLKALDHLQIQQPTEVQTEVIPRALNAKDLLVSAQTGSGKTFAFLLPILHAFLQQSAPRAGTRALILTPTRELAEQVCKACEQLSAFTFIKALSVCGGEGFREQSAKIRKNPEVIVGTPGRIIEHLDKGSLDFKDLEFLVLDEADRMLDMGFREDVLKITHACRPERQTLLFSATLKKQQLGELIAEVLRDPETCLLSSAQTQVEAITQQRVLADDLKHKERLVHALLQSESANQVIVFTNTRSQANHLGNVLRYHKHRAAVLHGEMDQPQRRQVIRLLRDQQIRVLVATDVAARGLDIEGIDLVINFEMPRSGDEYVHRIGRTGRAGREGLAITLIAPQEWNLMSSVERYLKIRLEPRSLPGFEGQFTGPKRVKASGKASTDKKKKDKKGSKGEDKPKVKKRLRDQKSIGKRRTPSVPGEAATQQDKPATDQGFAPLKRKTHPN
ncbi:DEAD/DEAH box helicase [Nitrincola tapanii]|uniref:DEAD/DEAH box helicase n=1 Tax=Nitrincola tapanii TaxID=1708751 RepID=A0A5A9W550_9GAMM|nr:DEAD/DEAH box helicase [Nitrincola tapanii]KAA0874701.1 DEAD/DEAH box helicase [Nitrincola tapanii]